MAPPAVLVCSNHEIARDTTAGTAIVATIASEVHVSACGTLPIGWYPAGGPSRTSSLKSDDDRSARTSDRTSDRTFHPTIRQIGRGGGRQPLSIYRPLGATTARHRCSRTSNKTFGGTLGSVVACRERHPSRRTDAGEGCHLRTHVRASPISQAARRYSWPAPAGRVACDAAERPAVASPSTGPRIARRLRPDRAVCYAARRVRAGCRCDPKARGSRRSAVANGPRPTAPADTVEAIAA